MYLNINIFINKKILVILIIIRTISAYSQFPITLKCLSGNSAYPTSICESYDSGFLMTGYNYYSRAGELFKLDRNGNVLWTRQLQGNSDLVPLGVVLAKDGGLWIYGETSTYDSESDGFFCKLNSCGDLEFGYILRSNGYNYIGELIQTNHDKLIIRQGGSSYIINGRENSWYGYFDLVTNEFKKTCLLPLVSRMKKSIFFDNSYYFNSFWYYKQSPDSSTYYLGSSIISYDSSMSFKRIEHLSPFDFQTPNYFPDLWSRPYVNTSNNILVGGTKYQVGSTEIFNFDRNLNLKAVKKSKSLIDTGYSEQIEYLTELNNDNYLLALNKFPPNSSNAKAYFAKSDSNFTRIKEIIYGDTVNFRYWLRDLIEVSGNNILVAMSQYKASNDIQYHLLRYNREMEIDTTVFPSKNYDNKCQSSISKFDIIADMDFDSIVLNKTPNLLYFSGYKELSNHEFLLYPNPNNGRFYLQHSLENQFEIEVFNSNGMKVFKSNYNCDEKITEVDISELKSGLYFISIISPTSTVYRKIIIN